MIKACEFFDACDIKRYMKLIDFLDTNEIEYEVDNFWSPFTEKYITSIVFDATAYDIAKANDFYGAP